MTECVRLSGMDLEVFNLEKRWDLEVWLPLLP